MMEKKNTRYVVFILVVVIFMLLLVTGQLERITGGDSDFVISDTSSVRRIRITGSDTIYLERSKEGWIVNGHYKADPSAIDNFLIAFSRLGISGVMNSKDPEELDHEHIRIWTGRKVRRLSFYPNEGVPLMSHKGSKRIYRIGITGLPGASLSRIFSDQSDYWKDKQLVRLSSSDIARIEVVPARKWGKGFVVARKEDGFKLEDSKGAVIPDSLVDQERLHMYTSYFGQIFYDSTYSNRMATQEILESDPDYTIVINDIKGNRYIIEMYPFKNSDGSTDIFHALVRFNKDKHLLVTRYIVLDLLRQRLSHFTVK